MLVEMVLNCNSVATSCPLSHCHFRNAPQERMCHCAPIWWHVGTAVRVSASAGLAWSPDYSQDTLRDLPEGNAVVHCNLPSWKLRWTHPVGVKG